ncbi:MULTISPECIES: hypothetical protein [unclassified Undibacterium]|uniref:hypothetical protein n=1 Tax=unclassified Undibacterium TaxID=2630295 RepID=UPI002AC96404|nr:MULTISPECIES: hypothetical protein [unclassified Undibacterium]MEB0139019.1 hypothetical protein [Undibacterium sp. CCC2.1]MEB0171886.1 hypothetical protein [Undibacterium sp. CCC1.1]MEB0175827.1 hypothetical protein [Undibacterium sp. CCC3.4]MEB0215107.1 hypothetical protein [Undibacterium sp. 5I2]WPX45074.1 hypothetical protein RHM61_07590 [Undibacterium sp. CCC3.4]
MPTVVAAILADAVTSLIQKVARPLRQQSKALLYLLDFTSIILKGREFDRWTLSNKTRNTQSVKLQLLYAAQAQILFSNGNGEAAKLTDPKDFFPAP